MASWLDKMMGRVRSATSDSELEAVKREFEQNLPPSLVVNGSFTQKLTPTNDMGLSLGGDDGTHLHLHLGGGGGGGMQGAPVQGGDQPPPQNGPAPPNAGSQGGDIETRMAAVEAAIATLTQQMSDLTGGGEEEVQLEEPNSKDARSYILRRGDKIRKVGDEELIVPVTNPEMMGETDLPGIQDLNYDGEGNPVIVRNLTATGDSFNMESVWQDTMAKAEIIVPGIRVPTFDGRIPQQRTTARLCAFRRQTLDAALKDANTADLVTSLTDIKNSEQIRHLSCDSTRMAFNVIAGAIGGQRNTGMVRSADRAVTPQQKTGTPSIAEIQRRNKEFYHRA